VGAQVQTRLRVGAFGAVSGRLPAVPVPDELKALLPEGFILREVLDTKMSPRGETLLLYDNGESIFPEVCLSAIRNGKGLKLFDEGIAAVGGLVPIDLKKNQHAVGFAYHTAGDESDTSFVIFAAGKKSYMRLFERETAEGQLRIVRESPLEIELWSADLTLDPSESCVWYPHRYSAETYIWRGNAFQLVARRTTPTALLPGDIARFAFQAGSGAE
jgi:hypothetical protein